MLQKKNNWVVGNPILHSMSPVLHNAIYKQLNLNESMETRKYDDAKLLIQDIREHEIGLTAVTMPLKEKVVEDLNQLDELAKELGLVNTIINKNNFLIGYNTDLDGIDYVFKKIGLANKKILIIGAGAVAKLFGYYFKGKAKNIYWFNRTKEKAEDLAKKYGGLALSEINIISDIIINTTPWGMSHLSGLPINSDWIVKGQIIFDVIYNPLETELLKCGKNKGAQVISGLDMFIIQGLRQIEIWQNKKIISEDIIKEMKELVRRGL